MKHYTLHSTKKKTEQEKVVIGFGIHKGLTCEQVPDDYLLWIVQKANKDQRYGNPWDNDKFKIPSEIEQEARRVLFSRGYTVKGERWERK